MLKKTILLGLIPTVISIVSCQNSSQQTGENGKDSLSQYIDSSFVTFFVDGHYETECYGKDRNKAMKLNHFWAWHPSLSDRFGYWIIQRPREDDKYYTIIRELTANELKTTESRFDGLFSYTFEPTDR